MAPRSRGRVRASWGSGFLAPPADHSRHGKYFPPSYLARPQASLVHLQPGCAMPDFRLWGRVEQIGPSQFLAIVSAVPDTVSPDFDAGVELVTAPTHGEAWHQLETLAVTLGEKVRQRGGRIVEIEID